MTFESPLYMQNKNLFEYSARQDRFIIDTLFQEGIVDVGGGQGLAVQRPAGANMSVYVPPFDAIIDGDDGTRQGAYLVRCTVGEFPNVQAAPATGFRLDRLVVEIIDSEYRTATPSDPEGVRLRVIPGTVAATQAAAVLPDLPKTALSIASVSMAAGQISVQTQHIADLRTQSGAATLKVGTQVLPQTQTQRDAITTPFDGQVIHNLTQSALESGDAATGTWASTRPLGLFFGNGSDGDVTIVGTVTLARDMQYRNLTVPAGATLLTNGWRVAATGTVRVAGTVSNDGAPGTDGVVSNTFTNPNTQRLLGGAAPVRVGRLGVGNSGGAGGVWAYESGGGSSSTLTGLQGGSQTYGGGPGGRGGYVGQSPSTAGPAGGVNSYVASPSYSTALAQFYGYAEGLGIYGTIFTLAGALAVLGGGGGGGGGTSNGAQYVSGTYSHQSGSGGAGGGVIVIACEALVLDGTISASGGRGGAGAGGQSAGGGGGGGGVVLVFARRRKGAGQLVANGGTTSGSSPGVPGSSGIAQLIGV